MVDGKEKVTFADDLRQIDLFVAGKTRVTIGDLEAHLDGRGFATIALILSLPFVQPIPLPGVSILFGLIHMAVGLRLTFGHHGGLPAWVKKRDVDAQSISRMALAGAKLFSKFERIFKPRLSVCFTSPLVNLIGVSQLISGLALSLPLPPVILFSNSIPAWAIIMLALGYLERDGLFIILGHMFAIATWLYFALWGELVMVSVRDGWQYLQDLLLRTHIF